MNGPLLSVVIPAHNAAPFLAEAVQSVREQTLQVATEILIYDDGSNDGTAEVIAALGTGVVAFGGADCKGPAYARNRCLDAARGELLAFQDADDVWMPDKLELQMAVLRENPQPCAVFGLLQEFNADGPVGNCKKAAMPQLCLMRREVALAVGQLDESLLLGDFPDWLVRLQALPADLLYVDRLLVRRRLHDGNLGRRAGEARKSYLEVIRRKLARDRQVGAGQPKP